MSTMSLAELLKKTAADIENAAQNLSDKEAQHYIDIADQQRLLKEERERTLELHDAEHAKFLQASADVSSLTTLRRQDKENAEFKIQKLQKENEKLKEDNKEAWSRADIYNLHMNLKIEALQDAINQCNELKAKLKESNDKFERLRNAVNIAITS